ncbi:MAG: Two-component system, NarL family, sensor histidine kinase BarA [Candidatus Saccharibacteria bacterium]|nr:Two-component system, NarL family, sensor histidine kinase BarA [Candidatus Saccharibacteria bacterium]
MNIRLKTLGINTLAVASVLFILYQVSAPLILHGFEKVETNDAIQNVGRATDAINSQLFSLSSKLIDWASWDDSYNFAADKNNEFVQSNFGGNDTYKSPIFDMILYFNTKGKLVYANGSSKPSAELLDKLSPTSPLLKYDNAANIDADAEAVSGIITTKEGILLASSRPILHNDGSGPTHGSIIFTKFLTTAYIGELAETAHLDLGFYPVNSTKLPPDAIAIESSLSVGKTITKAQNSTIINGYTLLAGLDGKPAVLVRVNLDREIYDQGRESLHLFLIILLVAGVLFPLVTSILLDALVIRRIELLTKNVTKINDQNGLKNKLTFKGSDEVALLATSINHMLQRIEDSNQHVHSLVGQLKIEKEGVEDQVRQRTHQLEEEKTRFFASINSLPLGFILTDSSDHVLMMNPSIKKILSFSSDDAKSIAKKIAEKDSLLLKLMEHTSKVTDSKKISTIELSTPEGRFLHALAAPVLTHAGTVDGTVIIVEDVTEAKIMERSKEEFFSIASHELRTPLTAIRGNTSLIKQLYEDQLKDPSFNEMVDDIHSSSMRLISIVNDFLDVSSLEQGKIKFTEKDFDISTTIEEVIKEMNGMVTEKKLYLTFEKPAQALPLLHADPNRIKQVIYNLIGNSIKFTETGGVTIKTEVMPNKMLKIMLIDTGRGISPEGQQLLFHKFQQTGESLQTRDTTRGTGLGLYISKLIVEHFGGQIKLDASQEGDGHGSTFSITLPLA